MRPGLDESGLLAAFFGSMVFLIAVSCVSQWWATRWGRSVVSLDAALFIALLPTALHYLTGLSLRDEFFTYYYAGSMYLACATSLWRAYQYVRFHLQDGAEPPGPPEPQDAIPTA